MYVSKIDVYTWKHEQLGVQKTSSQSDNELLYYKFLSLSLTHSHSSLWMRDFDACNEY